MTHFSITSNVAFGNYTQSKHTRSYVTGGKEQANLLVGVAVAAASIVYAAVFVAGFAAGWAEAGKEQLAFQRLVENPNDFSKFDMPNGKN